ncbi:hypothetical protein IG631_16325 [Alternaria alternata]|nr:hypothetical protein IG631_16325 [Alternaria alternata]
MAWYGFGKGSSQSQMVQSGARHEACCMNVWNDWIRRRLASTRHATLVWD